MRIDMWVIYGLVMLVSLKKHNFSITRFVLCVNFTLVKLTTLKKHVLDHHLMINDGRRLENDDIKQLFQHKNESSED